MVKFAEYSFCVQVLSAVINGTECKKHQETECINSCPHNARNIARFCAYSGKNRNAYNAKQYSKAMRYGISHLAPQLSQGIHCGNIQKFYII